VYSSLLLPAISSTSKRGSLFEVPLCCRPPPFRALQDKALYSRCSLRGAALPPALSNTSKLGALLEVPLCCRPFSSTSKRGALFEEPLCCRSFRALQDDALNSPAELNFAAGNNGYDAATSLHTSIRLGQLIHLATKADEREADDAVKPEMDDYKAALMTGQRQELEKAYLGCYQEVAKINHQGSDHFTAVINRSLARDELAYTDLKHIVPYMPDMDSNKSSTRKKTPDGDSYVEESIWEPSGEKQWKQTMTVFRTTLLMCLTGNPNQTKLKLTKMSLDEFYDWLYDAALLSVLWSTSKRGALFERCSLRGAALLSAFSGTANESLSSRFRFAAGLFEHVKRDALFEHLRLHPF
jgi:hypothetical protein